MSNERTSQTTDETDGTEWAAIECAAMELWGRDPNADDGLWSDLGDSIRGEYRDTARAVIQIWRETMDGN
jgi:hypothetical protein